MGRVSIVAPITATEGALAAVLAVLPGERLERIQIAGVAIIVVGITILAALQA